MTYVGVWVERRLHLDFRYGNRLTDGPRLLFQNWKARNEYRYAVTDEDGPTYLHSIRPVPEERLSAYTTATLDRRSWLAFWWEQIQLPPYRYG